MKLIYKVNWFAFAVIYFWAAAGWAQTGNSGSSGGPISGSDQQVQAADLVGKHGQKQVDLFTGSFGYDIPINCAPARNGSEPNLALTYSSAGDNDWCGMGWSLNIGSIERNIRNGFPIVYSGATPASPLPQYDDTKGFMLNLLGQSYKLFAVATNGAQVEYRAEVDTAFLRCFLNTANNNWTVYDKSGNAYYFGETTASRVSNPKTGWSGYSGTFQWALDQIVTATGDWTTIAYNTSTSPYTGLPERTLYPAQISYNGHTNCNGYSANFAGPNKIIFQTTPRSDWHFSFRWGFRTDQCRTLTNILCQAGTQNVSSYSFNYGLSQATARSLLTNVVIFGYNANNQAATLLTNAFAYQANPNAVSYGPTILWTNLVLNAPGTTSGVYDSLVTELDTAQSMSYSVADLIDMDGDGLPDRVCYNTNSPNGYQVQKNLGKQANGNGSFGSGYYFGPTSTGPGSDSSSNPFPVGSGYTELNTPNGRIRDINGDGLPDRVMGYWASLDSLSVGIPYVPFTNYEVQINTGQGFSGVSPWPVNPGPLSVDDYNSPYYYCVESGGANVGFIDINGDGLPDRVMSGWYTSGPMTNFVVQFNTGTNFAQPMLFGPYYSQNFNGTVSGQANDYTWAGIETSEAHMIDINGDGLPDRLMYPMDPNNPGNELANPTYYAVEYNDGYSFESTNTSTSVPGAYDQWPGGSGLQTPNGGVTPAAINNLPYVGLFDLNGDGLPDRVMLNWVADTNNGATSTSWLVFLNNGHGFNSTPIVVTNIQNQGQNSQSYTPTWWSMQGSTSSGMVSTLIDINGDGLLDRVMAVYDNGYNNATSSSNYFLVQLNQGPFPDLLTNVNNGIGGNIAITYNPSTAYDNRVDPTNPNSVSHMPFPRYAAASVTVSDGINSPQTTTYGYGGGYYDGPRREFHGYAVVTNTDPTLRYTVTYFHTGGGRNYSALGEYQDTNSTTGAGNFAKVGMAYRVETYGNDNQLYHVQVNQVNQTSLGNARYFPFTTATFDCDYPGNGTPNVTAIQFAYDSTGNVTNKIEYGQVINFNPASVGTFSFTDANTNDTRYYNTTFAAISGNSYIVNHPATAILADINRNTVKETDYSYNSLSGTTAAKLTRISAGYYASNCYGYNTYGLAAMSTNPVGVVTTINYDSTYNTYPATTQIRANPGLASTNDFISTTVYDPRSGAIASSTDPMGVTVTNSYDSFCRITESDKIPVGGSAVWMKKFTYPTSLASITLGMAVNYVDVLANDGVSGVECRTYIDGFGRSIETITQGENGNYRMVATAYDPRGSAFLTTWPTFVTSSNFAKPTSGLTASWTGFDAAGRAATNQTVNVTFTSNGAFSSASPLAGDTGSPLAAMTWSYVYNSNPWWIVWTDADGKVRRHGLDAFGRTNQIQEVDGANTYTTTLNYDLADNLTNIVNANNENVYWAYNDAGDVVAMADPYLGQWTYQRDYAGRVRVQTDGRGDVIQFSYVNPTTGFQDAMGRLQTKLVYATNYTSHTFTLFSTVTNLYDVSDDNINFPVFKGLLYKTTDSQGWEKSGYDPRARTIIAARHLNLKNQTYTNSFVYDDGNNVTAITYPNGGPTISNAYFHGGSISTVSRGTYTYYTVSAANYDEFEHVTSFGYGNGLTTSRTYYSISKRLNSISCGGVFTRTFTYSNSADIATLYGTGIPGTVAATYDNLHRIKTYSGLTNSYAYDPTGNITNNIEGGGSSYTYANPRKQAVRTAFGYTNLYDLCGNMIVRHGGLTNSQALTYDPENQLLAIAQAGVMSDEFGYAADGARLWKRINQNPTNIQVWIGNNYEEKGGKVLFHVFAGGQQVCTFEPSSILNGGTVSTNVGYYYHEDNLNTSSVLSSGATTGTQIEVDVYYPFGRTLTATPQASFQVSRRFTGQVFDAESGLYYCNARYYDPELGRFIQPDTTIPDLSNPQSYNRYSYCVNNPLSYNDPTGHAVQTTWYQDLGTIVGNWFETSPQKGNATYASMRTAALGPTENILPGMVAKGVGMTGHAAQSLAEQYVAGKALEVGAAAVEKAGGAVLSKVAGVGEKVEQVATTAKPGKLGNQATQDQVADIAGKLKDKGWNITGGGGEKPEEYIPGPGGARKGSSYPDITATKEGKTLRVNTIDTRADGVTPSTREANNAARIRAQKPSDTLILIPKPNQ